MSDAQSDNTPASSEPAPMTDAEVAASNIPPDPDPGLEPAEYAPLEPSALPPDAPPPPEHPAESALQRMEEIALLWGGDVMAELRHLVAEVRSHL